MYKALIKHTHQYTEKTTHKLVQSVLFSLSVADKRRQSLVMGTLSNFHRTLINITDLTLPDLSGNTLVILPKGHCHCGEKISWIRTMSPGWRFSRFWCYFHLNRMVFKYSETHIFQNWSAANCTIRKHCW